MATLLIDGNCFFEMHIIKNWDKCDGEILLVWVDFVASIAWFYSYCWIYCNFFENLYIFCQLVKNPNRSKGHAWMHNCTPHEFLYEICTWFQRCRDLNKRGELKSERDCWRKWLCWLLFHFRRALIVLPPQECEAIQCMHEMF